VSFHSVKWQAVVFFLVQEKISTGKHAHVDVILALLLKLSTSHYLPLMDAVPAFILCQIDPQNNVEF
jgi:hypothetical protein